MRAARIKEDITVDVGYEPKRGTRAYVDYISALIADLQDYAEFATFEEAEVKFLEMLHDTYIEDEE